MSCLIPRGLLLPCVLGQGDWQPSGRGTSNALRLNPFFAARVPFLTTYKASLCPRCYLSSQGEKSKGSRES